MNLKRLNRRLIALESRHDDLVERRATLQRKQKELMKLEQAHDEVAAALRTLSSELQQQFFTQLNGIVTRCLRTVFGNEYQFELEQRRTAKRTTVQSVLYQNDVKTHLADSVGGGVLDVVSFGLRLACLLTQRKQLAQVLILDEPFKFLSAGYQQSIAELFKSLQSDLGIQIVMVTHVPSLEVGTVVRVGADQD